MNLIDKGRILFYEREIRHLKMRKMHPDRYQNIEPQTDAVIDELIQITQEKINAIKRKVD